MSVSLAAAKRATQRTPLRAQSTSSPTRDGSRPSPRGPRPAAVTAPAASPRATATAAASGAARPVGSGSAPCTPRGQRSAQAARSVGIAISGGAGGAAARVGASGEKQVPRASVPSRVGRSPASSAPAPASSGASSAKGQAQRLQGLDAGQIAQIASASPEAQQRLEKLLAEVQIILSSEASGQQPSPAMRGKEDPQCSHKVESAALMDRLCDQVSGIRKALRGSEAADDPDGDPFALASVAEEGPAHRDGVPGLTRLAEMVGNLHAQVRNGFYLVEDVDGLEERRRSLHAEVADLEERRTALQGDVTLMTRRQRELEEGLKLLCEKARAAVESSCTPPRAAQLPERPRDGIFARPSSVPPLQLGLVQMGRGTPQAHSHSAASLVRPRSSPRPRSTSPFGLPPTEVGGGGSSCSVPPFVPVAPSPQRQGFALEDRVPIGAGQVLMTSMSARLVPHVTAVTQPALPVAGVVLPEWRFSQQAPAVLISPRPGQPFGPHVVPHGSHSGASIPVAVLRTPPLSPRLHVVASASVAAASAPAVATRPVAAEPTTFWSPVR